LAVFIYGFLKQSGIKTGAYIMANKMEQFKTKVETMINQDPQIRDTTHIGISIQSSGALMWKKSSLKVMGRVNRQEEYDAMDKIIESLADEVKITNNLRVENKA